jgi:hypothetical protein
MLLAFTAEHAGFAFGTPDSTPPRENRDGVEGAGCRSFDNNLSVHDASSIDYVVEGAWAGDTERGQELGGSATASRVLNYDAESEEV